MTQVRSNVPRLVLSHREAAVCFGRILGAFGCHRRYVIRHDEFMVREHPRSTPTFVSQALVCHLHLVPWKFLINSSHLFLRFLSHFYRSSVENCILRTAEIFCVIVFEDGRDLLLFIFLYSLYLLQNRHRPFLFQIILMF